MGVSIADILHFPTFCVCAWARLYTPPPPDGRKLCGCRALVAYTFLTRGAGHADSIIGGAGYPHSPCLGRVHTLAPRAGLAWAALGPILPGNLVLGVHKTFLCMFLRHPSQFQTRLELDLFEFGYGRS